MNIYSFVQFTGVDLSQCRWLRFHERTPAGPLSYGAFEDALAAAEGQHLVVFVPSTEVNLASIDLKAKSHKQMMAAVPYMLEEELSEDVENLHFALATIDKKAGKQLVGVISGELIAKLYSAISTHNYLSVAVVPQTLSIPYARDTWSLFIQSDAATLRTGEYDGYGIDIINLHEILSVESALYRQQQEQDVGVDVAIDVKIVEYDFRADSKQDDLSNDLPAGELDAAGGNREALALIGRYWLDHQGMLNLLQGAYQMKAEMPGTLKQWLIAASLMGISLLLFIANTVVTNQQLSAQTQQLEQTMRSTYTQIFHDEPAAEAATAMRKRLIAMRESSGGPVTPFLQFVAASAEVLLKDKQSSVVRMSYNNKRLQIDIETTAFEKLEALQQKIASDVISVDLKAVTNNKGKINGRLVLAGVKR
jgi:general secretion pathway protein L